MKGAFSLPERDHLHHKPELQMTAFVAPGFRRCHAMTASAGDRYGTSGLAAPFARVHRGRRTHVGQTNRQLRA
jgi:hypothetical protein